MSEHTENEIVIDASMDLVWAMTNDVANWTNLFSEYSEATVLRENEGRVLFRLALHPDNNGVVWSWISERIPDPEARTVRAWRVDTGPFKYMSIFWEYLETEDGVRMRWLQDFEMKPNLPVDDAEMKARLNRNTPVQIRLIKERIEAAAAARVS